MPAKENRSTLVLNRSWLAVQICSVKRALSLVYQGHAKVVDGDFQSYDFEDWSQVSRQMIYDPEDFICSPSLKIKIPKVIVLLLYDKLPRRMVKFSRKNIFERDNFTCQYCGKKPPNRKAALKWMERNELSLEHILPRSKGGKTTWSNVVTACSKCNSKKGSSTLEEIGWRLRKEPKAPEWRPTVNVSLRVTPHKEWVNFLDLAYNNVELDNDNESANDN